MSGSGSDRKKQLVIWKGYASNDTTSPSASQSCPSPKSYRILEGKNVLKVAIGGRHLLFMTSDQEVYAVGANNHKQLGKFHILKTLFHFDPTQ